MNVIDKCFSVKDPFLASAYESCKLMKDGTLSFEYDDNRGGGSFLNKDFYENYGDTYENAVAKYLSLLEKKDSVYYDRIQNMLLKNMLLRSEEAYSSPENSTIVT